MGTFKRNAVWYVRFQFKGKSVVRSSGSGLRADAAALEKRLRKDLARQYAEGDRETFDAMMIRFAEEHLPRIKETSARRYRASARNLIPHFRGMAIDAIGRGAIADFVSYRRREGVTDATIRRDLACLSSALSCAVQWGWAEHNVVKAVGKRGLRESRPRVRWLRPAEYIRIQDAAPAGLKAVIVVLAETGMRLGELLALDWSDLDPERREAYLTKTKTDSPRTVPLTDRALSQMLLQPRHLTCRRIFFTRHGTPHKVNVMSRRLGEVFRKAEIRDATTHDLRHTFASRYLQGGGRIERLQEILGHSRIDQTRKYAHFAIEHLHEDLQRVVTKAAPGATESEQ